MNSLKFEAMWAGYPSGDPHSVRYVSREKLFKDIGWDDLVDNANYQNTCAIRVSISLLNAGAAIETADHTVLAGPLKGRKVIVRWKDMAFSYLPRAFGDPAVIANPTPEGLLTLGNGVVAFDGIDGYSGHIDLLRSKSQDYMCGTQCYRSKKVLHWPVAS